MTEPLLEIEMKFRVPNLAEYEQIARERLGVEFGAPKREDDLFFRNDALGFPDQGKSLRIRRRDDYLAATFKGPRLDAQTKTREELELPLANATGSVDDAQREWTTFFERLGFAPAARVVKTRRRASLSYSSREFELTLDVLEGIGVFTEIETTAPRLEFDAAKKVLLELAESLDLRASETKSYLALALEAATGKPIDEK